MKFLCWDYQPLPGLRRLTTAGAQAFLPSSIVLLSDLQHSLGLGPSAISKSCHDLSVDRRTPRLQSKNTKDFISKPWINNRRKTFLLSKLCMPNACWTRTQTQCKIQFENMKACEDCMVWTRSLPFLGAGFAAEIGIRRTLDTVRKATAGSRSWRKSESFSHWNSVIQLNRENDEDLNSITTFSSV